MGEIKILFHGKLNDFLPAGRKNRFIEVNFNHKTAIKHVIESLGVPHPEVSVIRGINGTVGFDYHIRDQDIIEVFPVIAAPDDEKPDPPSFVLDNHLGKLTGYLRILGFDALYNHAWDDSMLAEIASTQDRTLLTRDRGLLKRKIIISGYCVRADLPQDQILEVLHHFQLHGLIMPFYRCSRCNGILEQVEKKVIIDQLQPLTRIYFNEFTRCRQCGQIYWKGSHYDKIEGFIRQIIQKNQNILNNDPSSW